MTKTQPALRNETAAFVGLVVLLLLALIFPASRTWIVDHFTPVVELLVSWVAGLWSLVTNLF